MGQSSLISYLYYLQSSISLCPCPFGGGSDIVAVDFTDGYPSEYGPFTADISDYSFNRDTTESAYFAELIGLPVDVSAPSVLNHMLGSGILVKSYEPEYEFWKAYRMDCGCLKYTCDPNVALLPCSIQNFVDANGFVDTDPDRLELTPALKLTEDIGLRNILMDGVIRNLMTFDPDITNSVDSFNGITAEGIFTNFVDEYGVVYCGKWTINGDTIDITGTTYDPRVPGVAEPGGKVERVKKGFRVFRNGIVYNDRQIIKMTDNTYVAMNSASDSKLATFQTTFGCGGDPSGDPFFYHINSGITDVVELIFGTESERSPAEPEEFVWFPYVFNDSQGRGIYFPSNETNAISPADKLEPVCKNTV